MWGRRALVDPRLLESEVYQAAIVLADALRCVALALIIAALIAELL